MDPSERHGTHSYGSTIRNPTPLTSTFFPTNFSSANLHPEIIDDKLKEEALAGCMSGPFMVAEATAILGGFFCSSPVGWVEKVPGNGIWCKIRHLST